MVESVRVLVKGRIASGRAEVKSSTIMCRSQPCPTGDNILAFTDELEARWCPASLKVAVQLGTGTQRALIGKLPLVLLAFAAIVTVLSSLMVFHPQPITSSMMSGMMSHIVGESMTNMPLLWPSLLTISAAVVLIGLGYLIAFPAIKFSEVMAPVATDPFSTGALDPLTILIRVSKPDERAVLEVLRGSGGMCRQKDIVFKTGLSKIKVHRILARLSERGAIQVKKTGKTNEVTVPNWLMRNRSDTQTV